MVKLTPEVLARMNIPPNQHKAVISKIPNHCSHKARFEEYVENLPTHLSKGEGILLWGDYSRGKSALAAIILKAAFVKTGTIGYWIRSNDVFQAIVKEERFDDELTVFDRMVSVPLLVIDELQVWGDSKFRETAVEDIIRQRVDAQLATVLTTNLNSARILEAYPAMHAALIEACVTTLKVEGHDFRKSMRGIQS